MQKIITIVVLICAIAFQVNAQENRNQTYNITLGNVQYAHHDEKVPAIFDIVIKPEDQVLHIQYLN